MDMYATGEIEEVLKSFEKALELNNVYIGCKIEKSEKETKVLPNGRIKKIYRTYYDNGNLNNMFKLYLSGYSAGKLEGRLQSS